MKTPLLFSEDFKIPLIFYLLVEHFDETYAIKNPKKKLTVSRFSLTISISNVLEMTEFRESIERKWKFIMKNIVMRIIF